MKIENIGYKANLSLDELSSIMAALRIAARHHGQISSGSNPFFDLHGLFVGQTGFCGESHKDLRNELDKLK